MYGQELKHTKLLNWKGKLVFTIFGETFPGHLIRFFINCRYLKKYANEDCSKILEMGSNNGAFSLWLGRNTNYTVVGLENNKTLVIDCQHIRNSINRLNLYFIYADASKKFPLKDNFDMIFSTHVLEHILNDKSALLNAYNSLKPGGLLILQVPYGDPNKRPTNEAIANGHIRDGYTESDIREKLEHSGFEIVSATGSIGRIGRFAYQFARKLAKIRILFNFSILFFPITLILIYLEQAAAFIRKHEPSFENWPVVIAKRPLYEE